MVVYLVVNKINGKYYVGKTVHTLSERWSRHKYSATHPQITKGHYFTHAIRKYGIENFIPCTLAETDNEEELANLEQEFIYAYQSNNPFLGYNLTDGGEGSVGFKHSNETKELLRALKLGKKRNYPISEKQRLAIVESNRNRIWTPEMRRRRGDSQLGSKKS